MDYCDQQKSKDKAKTSCNVVCASSREAESDVASLTDLEEESIVLAAEQGAQLVAETRFDQQYLKKYDEAAAISSKPDKAAAKQSTKQPVEKKKEFRYAKTLQKDKAEGSLMPFRFNVLAQLANISVRITLYELLRVETLHVNERSSQRTLSRFRGFHSPDFGWI